VTATASPLLTAREAMEYLRVKSRSYLTEHADEIGVVRRGGRIYFRLEDLEAWDRRHYVAPTVAATEPTSIRASRPNVSGRMNPLDGKPFGRFG